jgi:hypothetical protein
MNSPDDFIVYFRLHKIIYVVFVHFCILHPCQFPTSTTVRIQRMITCSHQNTWPAEKQKEYNLHHLLTKVRTTRGKELDRLRQWGGK